MKYITGILLITLTFGCNRAQEDQSAPAITVEDIAHALQMQKWTIRMPADVPENTRLGIQLVVNDTEKHDLMRLASAHGETTTLFLWDNEAPNRINYRSTCDTYSFMGTIEHDVFVNAGRTTGLNADKICTVGDEIMQLIKHGGSHKITICLVDYVD